MTYPTSASIRAEIATLTLHMNKAREDVDLYDRLKKAAGEHARLAKLCNELTGELHEALTEEDRERRKAQAAPFRNLSVLVKPDNDRPGNPIAATYIIRYERLQYDPTSRTTDWRPVEIKGFAALPQDAYTYLMQHKAEAVPHEIMTFAPGDPVAAMRAYFTHLQRGYIRG